MVAGVVVVLAGLFDFVGPGWISFYVLLLSRQLLQGVLGGSAGLRCGRTAEELLGRALIPAHYSEHSQVLSVPRSYLHIFPRS